MSVYHGIVRRFAWLVMALAIAGPVALASSDARAEPAALNAPHVAVLSADLGPLARIDLTWPNAFRYTWQSTGRTLTLSFDQSFNAPDLGALRRRLGSWIAGISKDADQITLTASQDVYFNVVALDRVLTVEMTYASTAANAPQLATNRPVLIPPSVRDNPGERPRLINPAERKRPVVKRGAVATPVTTTRPADNAAANDAAANDALATQAAKRLRRGAAANTTVTLSASTQTQLTAEMTSPPQLKAQVGEDVAVLVIDWAQLVVVTPESVSNEILLRLDRPVDPRLVEGLAKQLPEWLNSATAGYDSLLFVAAPGVRIDFQHGGRSSTVSLSRGQAATGAGADEAQSADVRLEILRARLKARTGETDKARQKLSRLQTTNPDNADVLVELANIEESVGSWRRASGLYERAIGLDPERRDAAAAQRALDREFGEFVRVDMDYQAVEDGDDQIITVVSGRFLPSEMLDIGFSAENRYLNDDQVQRVNGNIDSLSIHRQRAEIYVGGSPASGHRIEGAVLGSQAGPGAALRYVYRTPDTLTAVSGTLNRAYWELVEGIADDATQDRVSLRHENQISLNWSGSAEIGYNRYDIASVSDAASSYDLSASLRYRIPWEVTDMSVGYSFNGQYVGDVAVRRDINGNAFNPLPLSDTEIHSLDASFSGLFADDWRYNLFGSLSFDRFGGFGPSVGCEVTHEVKDDIAYGLRCGHSRVSGRGDDAAFTRLGGFLLVRF